MPFFYTPMMPRSEGDPPTRLKTRFEGTVSLMLFSTETKCLDYVKTRTGETCHALDKEALLTQLNECLRDGFTHVLIDSFDHRPIEDCMKDLRRSDHP